MSDAPPFQTTSPTEADEGARLVDEVRRALSTPGLTPGQLRAVVRLAEAAAHTLRRSRANAEQARLFAEMRDEAERRRRMLDGALWAAGAGLWECRLSDEQLDWSAGVYDLFGFANGRRLHRRDTLDVYTPASLEALDKVRGEAIRTGGRFSLDAEITTAKGARRWIRLSGAVEQRNGVAVRLYGLKQDVTRDHAIAEQTRRLAEIDALTGLANRRLFDERLANLAHDPAAALLLIDLDGFKALNDALGHAHGDACLQEAARRLESACRTAALVARLGGDEFAVLLADGATGKRTAQRVVEALRISIERDGAKHAVSASVGVARADGATPAEWFARADLALYDAKGSGRNGFSTFEPAMAARAMGLRLVG